MGFYSLPGQTRTRMMVGLPVSLTSAERRQLRDGSVGGELLPTEETTLELDPVVELTDTAYDNQLEEYGKALDAAYDATHGIVATAAVAEVVQPEAEPDHLQHLEVPAHAGALVAAQLVDA
ncbi:MAG TPA: hypothetical protein VD735_04765 [Candidatus Saccharimonadales bacterium]|nr:hypothetical protein [Candidatus Saccharimonadales bacterium]